MDAIKIKNQIEWYHIRINSCLPTFFIINSVFSEIILIGNEITDNVGDGKWSVFFSSYKALYIDHGNLIPWEINEKQFIEFYKPEELNIM